MGNAAHITCRNHRQHSTLTNKIFIALPSLSMKNSGSDVDCSFFNGLNTGLAADVNVILHTAVSSCCFQVMSDWTAITACLCCTQGRDCKQRVAKEPGRIFVLRFSINNDALYSFLIVFFIPTTQVIKLPHLSSFSVLSTLKV